MNMTENLEEIRCEQCKIIYKIRKFKEYIFCSKCNRVIWIREK